MKRLDQTTSSSFIQHFFDKPALVGCNSFFIWVWKSGGTIQKHSIQASVTTPFSWAYEWCHLIGLELMVGKEGLEKSGGELTPAVRHNWVAVSVALVDRWRWLCCLVDCGICSVDREGYWINSEDIADCGKCYTSSLKQSPEGRAPPGWSGSPAQAVACAGEPSRRGRSPHLATWIRDFQLLV